ncbi:MAG: GspH/FimT family pseudopilin [Pseudomonadota bacterium]
MRQVRGVTLVEACVVLAVSTVILTAAAPAMRRLIDQQVLRGAAHELRTDLQFLRAAAVGRGRTLWLAVHGSQGGSCYVLYAGERGDCSCQADGSAACGPQAESLKVAGFPMTGAVQLQASTGLFGIEPLRGTVTPAATLKLIGRGGEAVHQVVNVMGRVRTCSPRGALPGFKAC